LCKREKFEITYKKHFTEKIFCDIIKMLGLIGNPSRFPIEYRNKKTCIGKNPLQVFSCVIGICSDQPCRFSLLGEKKNKDRREPVSGNLPLICYRNLLQL
jgi:hypothetical protein